MKDANKPYRINVVLTEIANSPNPLTPNEIAERTSLPKATAYRLCDQLREADLIRRQIGGRGFLPGPALYDLSLAVLSGRAVYAARHAVMQGVAGKIGETCNLSIPESTGMVYWDRVESHWPLRMQLPIGTHVPFHATAAGKMYLAGLNVQQRKRFVAELDLHQCTDHTLTSPDDLLTDIAAAKRRGYSIDNEEFLLGMVAVAVPVNDRNGRMVAALAVHAPKIRMSVRAARQHVPILVAAAERISEGVPEHTGPIA